MGRLHRARRLLTPLPSPLPPLLPSPPPSAAALDAPVRRPFRRRPFRRRPFRRRPTVHGRQHRPRSAPPWKVSTVHGRQHRPRLSAPSTVSTVHGQHRPRRSAPSVEVSTVHGGQHRPRKSAPSAEVSTIHGSQHHPRKSAPSTEVSTIHGSQLSRGCFSLSPPTPSIAFPYIYSVTIILTWRIRAKWLIWWPIVHLIIRIARIFRDLLAAGRTMGRSHITVRRRHRQRGAQASPPARCAGVTATEGGRLG
jgi:hypothetical protein